MSDCSDKVIYYKVTNLNDSGNESLRRGINLANENIPFPTIITFGIKGTIKLLSDLPVIQSNITIDASTFLDYTFYPLINLNCNGFNGINLGINANCSKIIGLSIYLSSSNGITINCNNVLIDKNFIYSNSLNGVYIAPNSHNNHIGQNDTFNSDYVSNTICGNSLEGIKLDCCYDNFIIKNNIGTNYYGAKPIPNGNNGILITNESYNNTIGGIIFVNSDGEINNPTGSEGQTTPTFIIPPLGNLISGNIKNGISITNNSIKNNLYGNFIGTNKNGTYMIGNNLNGVYIENSDSNVIEGCKVYNNPFVYYNVISGNGLSGINVNSSNKIIIQGNFFGINALNSKVLPNDLDGITISGTSSETQVGGIIPLGNVCSGNNRNGISVLDDSRNFTTFNTFGGGFAFGTQAPNQNNGIYFDTNGGEHLIRTNVFSGNVGNGIEITGNTYNVTVNPVIAGLQTDGNSLLSNGKNGLLIGGNANNIIVGGDYPSVISRNTFSGNDEYGICIQDNAYSNSVFYSYFGLNLSGETNNIGNKLGGIIIKDNAQSNTIGSYVFIDDRANYISDNENGIIIQNNTTYNQIINNYIGYDIKKNPAPNAIEQLINTSTGINNIAGNIII